MPKGLTRKEREFAAKYIETGNGTKSALEVYDIDPNGKDPAKTASVIASENLAKPRIIAVIAEALDDNLLADTHRAMLQQVRLDYFVFPKSMADEDIMEHVFSQGLSCVNIRPSDKGKLAFFAVPDSQARGKALELAYRVKGTFAPEKSVTLNIDVELTQRERGLGLELVQRQRTT